MTYRLTREIYDRCGEEYRESTFKASSDKLALALILDQCLYGFDMTKEEFEAETLENLKECIHDINGDSCDYIYSVTNLNTNEIIFREAEGAPDYEEDWDEAKLFDE